MSEDKPNEIVRLGVERSVIVSLHHKSPTGVVDHFAISVKNFSKDTVARNLKERGAEPSDNLGRGFPRCGPRDQRPDYVCLNSVGRERNARLDRLVHPHTGSPHQEDLG
jgi:hypothetical protein